MGISKKLYCLVPLAIVISSCGGGDGTTTTTPATVTPEELSALLDAKLENWVPPVNLKEGEPLIDIVPSSENISTTSGLLDCSYEVRNITQYVSELPSWVSSFSGLQPGMLLGSKDLSNGVPSFIPTGERDVSLFVSTGIPDPSIVVKGANSASIKTAVSELQRRIADSNIPIPAVISVKNEIITSNSEFEHKYNLSAGLNSKSTNTKLDFGNDTGGSGNAAQKYLVVKLIQPMYSISVSHDLYLTMSDFFGVISESVWDEYNTDRWMQPKFPPVFVSDVTYGRMIIFKIQVDESKSNEEVKTNFGIKFSDGTTDGNLSTGGNSEYTNALSQNRVELLVLGGTEQAAFDALKTGDFTQFFASQDARTAVPLNYTARHITGNREVVAIRSTLSYAAADCLICTTQKETEEISRSTILYQTGVSKPTIFSRCRQVLPPQRFTWTDCGTRQRFSYLINRFEKCNTTWTTNNVSDCSLDITGTDESAPSGGDCQVQCQLNVVALQEKPNQPPLCKF